MDAAQHALAPDAAALASRRLKPTVSQRPERGYSGREKGKQERTPFAELRSAIERETMVSKEPQPVHALQNANRRVCSKSTRERMATAGNGTAGRKPTSRETTSAV